MLKRTPFQSATHHTHTTHADHAGTYQKPENVDLIFGYKINWYSIARDLNTILWRHNRVSITRSSTARWVLAGWLAGCSNCRSSGIMLTLHSHNVDSPPSEIAHHERIPYNWPRFEKPFIILLLHTAKWHGRCVCAGAVECRTYWNIRLYLVNFIGWL